MPVEPPAVQFMILNVGDKVYVGLTWEDYLALAEFMTDINEFLESENILLCHYREEMNEPRCHKYNFNRKE